MGVLSTSFSHSIQNTALYQLLKRKLTLSQPKPGQSVMGNSDPINEEKVVLFVGMFSLVK